MIIPLLASVALACPNIDVAIERATAALIAGEFTAAGVALQAAESSFGCATANPTQIARFWLVQGAAAHLRADTAGARTSLAAARATAPTLFDDRLGPAVRATWATAEPVGSGSLLLEPPRPAFVDGASVAAGPLTLSAAPHVVQVIGADGAVRYGRVVRIAAGEDAMLDTGLGTEPEAVAATDLGTVQPATEPRRRKSPAMLILAGVAAAGAGACAGGALAQTPQMDAAGDVDQLNGALERQKVLGYSSYGLMGATAAALTLHFVIK